MTRRPIFVDMAEGDARQPVDADMDVGGGFAAAGNDEIAAARRTGTDEDRVVAFGQHGGEAVDAAAIAGLDAADPDDVADLLVDDRFGQAEARDLAADHAAAACLAVMDDNVVAERGKVAGDGERGGSGADQGDALAVSRRWRLRQAVADVGLVVGGDALQPADRDRLVLDPDAAAGRLARPVAGPPENPGKDVGGPVDHVGVAVAAGGDQADVFRHRRVGRAGPLAVDHLVKIVGLARVGGLHALPRDAIFRGAAPLAIARDLLSCRHSVASVGHLGVSTAGMWQTTTRK